MKITTKKCATKFCRKNAAKGRKFCYGCKNKKWAEKNPLRYSYINLKANAKRRGKEFSLTFEEFSNFAVETEYINKKGRKSESFHIDRIDQKKGYSIDNIQVLTNSENSKKYRQYITFDENQSGVPTTFNTKIIKPIVIKDTPF